MQKVALVSATGCAIALAAAACTGGGGGGGLSPADGRISSGRYQIVSSQVVTDECANYSTDNLDGLVLNLIVNAAAGTIELGTTTGTYENGVMELEEHTPFDWNDDPLGLGAFNCVEDDLFHLEARTPTDTTITDGTLTLEWTVDSGNECDAAYAAYSDAIGETVSLPCTTEVTFEAAYFPPQTGTINTAGGMNAKLTITGATTGSDFRLNYTLGGTPVVTANGNWTCYAPDPPTFPDYEVFAGDFYMAVTTAAWTVGNHAIDGNAVTVVIDDGSITANATGGTVNLITAPTSTTGTCNFVMTQVPIEEPTALTRPATSGRKVLGQK